MSARDVIAEEIETLIIKIDELKSKATNTRATKDKFNRLKSNSDKRITLIEEANRAFCRSLFEQNPKMTSDSEFKTDQQAFTSLIDRVEDALSELIIKLENEGVIAEETPAAVASDTDMKTLLLQMSKQWSDSQKHQADA